MNAAPRVGTSFVVAAPSGTGKTTVCKMVLERDDRVRFSVSHTTRAPRAGERDGLDYHFVSSTEFRRLVDAGGFLEHAEYAGQLYGTTLEAYRQPLSEGFDLLVEIEVQGARQLRKRLAEARFIFLLPPTMKVLEERLRGRATDDRDTIERRLAVADRELEAVSFFDYVVVNDELERATSGVLEIIHAQRGGRAEMLRERYGREPALARWRRDQDDDDART